MSDVAAAILNALSSSGPGAPALQHLSDNMDDDDMSVPDSPLESGDISPTRHTAAAHRSRAVLQTYLNSLPYQCESVEDMQAQLEYIVGKITICAKSKNWLVLTTWDGALQWSVTFVRSHSTS